MRAAAQETIKLIKDLDLNKSFDEEIDDGQPLGEIDQSQHDFPIDNNRYKDIGSENKASSKEF